MQTIKKIGRYLSLKLSTCVRSQSSNLEVDISIVSIEVNKQETNREISIFLKVTIISIHWVWLICVNREEQEGYLFAILCFFMLKRFELLKVWEVLFLKKKSFICFDLKSNQMIKLSDR